MHSLKTRFIPTVVVIGILVAAVYILFPFHRPLLKPGDPGAVVSVTVTFTPADRSGCTEPGRTLTDRVAIMMRVGPDNHPTDRECRSPWHRTVYPGKGQVVEVRAEQYFGIDLTCVIIQVDREPVTDSKHGPSRVHCRHTVT